MAQGGKALSGAKGKIAFVFPGQGSQQVGMGRGLYERHPLAQELLDQADVIVGFPLSEIAFHGPEEELSDTVNAQPAILAVSIACFKVFQAESGLIPHLVAGHSLGEFSALVAAGALEFPQALCLVRERGRLMKEAGAATPGGMAAVLGLGEEELEGVCQEASDSQESVQIANYNSPGQIVISGGREALERAIALAKTRGARRVVPLNVSIAGHSALMEPAAQAFAKLLGREHFHRAGIPLVANTSARPIRGVAEISEELARQLTSPVRWMQSVRYMVEWGVGIFIELGPKDVLSGLVRRIEPEAQALAIGDVAGLEKTLAILKGRIT